MSDQVDISGPRTALPALAQGRERAAHRSRWIATFALAFWLLQIVLTYNVFAPTFDEPAHIAAGMQLVDKGEFTYEPLHPPLARIAVALGPYAAGFRSQNGGDMWIEGRRLFIDQRGRTKDQLLTLARLGVLPF